MFKSNRTFNNSSPDKIPLLLAPSNNGDTGSIAALKLNSPLWSVKSNHSFKSFSRFFNCSKFSAGFNEANINSPNSPLKFSRKGSKVFCISKISDTFSDIRIYIPPVKVEKSKSS